MGKALIFSGVIIENPLQTVTFVKQLITASDYVNEYAKLVTSVTSEQKKNLTKFIETLIDNEIWDKVKCCFPMLGGLEGYNKDLKDVSNQVDWSTPTTGTSWDSIRNAPYLNLPGKAKGQSLTIEGMNNKDSAFLFSTKLKKESSGSILMSEYKYLGNPNSYLDELLANNGGTREPIWGTTKKNVSLEGYTYGKQSNNIYILNCQNGTNSLYACSNKPTVLTVGTGPTKEVQEVTVAFGGYFDAVKEAPATNTLNGCMNMFIAFSSALTEDKIRILSKAVWDFDEACGRHKDFA